MESLNFLPQIRLVLAKPRLCLVCLMDSFSSAFLHWGLQDGTREASSRRGGKGHCLPSAVLEQRVTGRLITKHSPAPTNNFQTQKTINIFIICCFIILFCFIIFVFLLSLFPP